MIDPADIYPEHRTSEQDEIIRLRSEVKALRAVVDLAAAIKLDGRKRVSSFHDWCAFRDAMLALPKGEK